MGTYYFQNSEWGGGGTRGGAPGGAQTSAGGHLPLHSYATVNKSCGKEPQIAEFSLSGTVITIMWSVTVRVPRLSHLQGFRKSRLVFQHIKSRKSALDIRAFITGTNYLFVPVMEPLSISA